MVGAYVDAPQTVIDDQWQLLEVVSSESQATLYRNGATAALGFVALPTHVTRTSNFIARSNRSDGVDSYLEGSIAELRIYARALDDTERIIVEGAMLTAWGLL